MKALLVFLFTLLAALITVPRAVSAQIAGASHPQGRFDASATISTTNTRREEYRRLLVEIESGLSGSDREFRASVLVDLGTLYSTIDRPKATQLWTDAFEATLLLPQKSQVMTLAIKSNGESSGSLAAAQASAYLRASESTPAITQARIFRELISRGDLKYATELFYQLPQRKAEAEIDKNSLSLPLLMRRDQELPRVLMQIPSALLAGSPDSSHLIFAEILDKFEEFPYSVAGQYVHASASNPLVNRMIVQALVSHFSGRDLDHVAPAVSFDAVDQFANLLPAMAKADAPQSASLVLEKLAKLQEESAFVRKMGSHISAKACVYLRDHESRKECAANPTTENSSLQTPPAPSAARSALPPELAEQLDFIDKEKRAIAASVKDISTAESIAADIHKPFLRGEALAEIASSANSADPARAGRLLATAIVLASEQAGPASQRLKSIVRIAFISSQIDPKAFSKATDVGLDIINSHSLNPDNADMEQLMYVDMAVKFLGLWSKISPDEAMLRARAIKDPQIRTRALVAIAQGGRMFQGVQSEGTQ